MVEIHRLIATVISAGTLVLAGSISRGAGDEPESPPASLRDGFETAQVCWEREHTDTTINLIAQERSVRAAHEGKLSERFDFEAEAGSQFFVSYSLPRINVTDGLEAVLYVRANRVGVQLYARVVLPEDIDPETRAPSFVLIPGTIYDRVDRWQRLELTNMLPSIERQARVLRASSRRPVSLKGAYLERLVVNLMGGSGASEVFLDDLSITPVPADIVAEWSKRVPGKNSQRKEGLATAGAAGQNSSLPTVKLEQNRLRRYSKDDHRYHDWLPTAIDAPGADVVMLRQYGFDLLTDDHAADPARIKAAVDKGFLLMPKLSGIRAGADPEEIIKQVSAYPYKDQVAFWMLGEGLGRKRELKTRDAELNRTRKLIEQMRQLPAEYSRLTTAIVDGDLPLFARAPGNLETIGIQPLFWASAQELMENMVFLNQRRRLTALSKLGALYWAWIPVSAPPIVRENIWGDDVPPAWGRPRVQPEQIRLMTYMALAAGYRGLGFVGDADLTRPAGQANLIELAFLNEEIDLFESILARSADPIPTYNVFDPDPPDIPPPGSAVGSRVRPQRELEPRPTLLAAAISVERKGALLLVADYAAYAQYQPPQMASHNLLIRPALPESAQAYEISPGEVKVLDRVRVPHGTQITLPEFSTTAMILCTTDTSLVERVQAAIAPVRPLAVQLAIEQAELMFQAATEINGRLAADGQHLLGPEDLKHRSDAGLVSRPTDERDLLAKAEASIKAAREAREREDFPLAWAEARRAERPLRHLMNGHWQRGFAAFAKAVIDSYPKINPEQKPKRYSSAEVKKKNQDDLKNKLLPEIPIQLKGISCPPAIAANTLPELYLWIDWIGGKKGFKFGDNRLPTGSFDDPDAMTEAGWQNVNYQVDGVTVRMATVPRDGSKTNRMIRMKVEATRAAELDTTAPQFFDFPVAAVRSPAIKVQAKNLIRISVLVKRPTASVPGMGGVIVRDSIGGEQFQFRTSDPMPSFHRVVLYRKAPADMDFTVTLGLAGYDEAFFDDLRVEFVEADDEPAGSELANRPANRRNRQPAPTPPNPSLPATAASPGETRRQRR
jgi:hypothetical protein